MDTFDTLGWTARLAGVGSAISCAEMLATRHQLAAGGILSWDVGRLRHGGLMTRHTRRVLDPLLVYPNVLVVICAALCASVTMLIAAPRGVVGSLLAAVVAIHYMLLFARAPQGQDGADQMNIVVFTALALAHAAENQLARETCIAFIALQLCVSYATAGVAKLISPQWRGGVALTFVFRTGMYGYRPLAALLTRHRYAAMAIAAVGIAFEILFPLALVLPAPYNLVLLGIGAGFHAGTAIFMGLNTFFWAFVAAYPAVVYLNIRVTS